MYERYYGLAEKPFSLTPDPKFLYRSPSHANAFELLQYAIRRREGFVVITGDIGTGKTTLCRALLEDIDRNTFTALVLNPFMSEEDLLKRILQDFGVISRDAVRFAARAVEKIHRLSGGIPRLINLICDRALLAGFAERSSRISAAMVDEAAASLEVRQAVAAPSRWAWLSRRAEVIASAAVV